MEEAQVQEPAVEQAPAQEAVTETVQEAPVQETQPEAPVQEAPAPEPSAPFEIFNNPQDLAASMQRALHSLSTSHRRIVRSNLSRTSNSGIRNKMLRVLYWDS